MKKLKKNKVRTRPILDADTGRLRYWEATTICVDCKLAITVQGSTEERVIGFLGTEPQRCQKCDPAWAMLLDNKHHSKPPAIHTVLESDTEPAYTYYHVYVMNGQTGERTEGFGWIVRTSIPEELVQAMKTIKDRYDIHSPCELTYDHAIEWDTAHVIGEL